MSLKRLTIRFHPSVEAMLFSIAFSVFSYFLGFRIYREGWYPREEGLNLEMAERVHQGQLPHYDFDSPSTGGMDYFHSMVQETFGSLLYTEKWKKATNGAWQLRTEPLGHSVLSPRIVLLTVTTIALLFLFQILRRFVPIAIAFAFVIASYFWSPVSYLVPSPKWYGAFFALLGAYLLLKFIEKRTPGWLIGAGVFAGLAVVFHLPSGCLQILAATFFFLNLDTSPKQGKGPDGPVAPNSRKPGTGTLIVKVVVLFFALLATVYILWQQSRPNALLYFGIGPVGLSLALLWAHICRPEEQLRARDLLSSFCFYLLGVVLVVLPYLLPYAAREGGIGLFWRGAVLDLLRAVQNSSVQFPDWREILSLVPLNGLVLILWLLHREKGAWWQMALIILTAFAGFIYSLVKIEYYPWIWSMLRMLYLETVFIGILVFWQSHRRKEPRTAEFGQRFGLILSFAVCLNLVQFPECSGVSFLYSFCFLNLMLAALMSPLVIKDEARSTSSDTQLLYRIAIFTWTGFISVFAWTYLVRGNAHFFAQEWMPQQNTELLAIDRAPVFVSEEDSRIYEGIVDIVQVCSKPGDYVLAFPDCPEVFSLSGRRNPLRNYGIPRKHGSVWVGIVSAIEQHNMKVLVYNTKGDPLWLLLRDSELMQYLSSHLPESINFYPLMAMTRAEPWYEWEKHQPSFGMGRPQLTKKKWPWNRIRVADQ